MDASAAASAAHATEKTALIKTEMHAAVSAQDIQNTQTLDLVHLLMRICNIDSCEGWWYESKGGL